MLSVWTSLDSHPTFFCSSKIIFTHSKRIQDSILQLIAKEFDVNMLL